MLMGINNKYPRIGENCFLAIGAAIIGRVYLGNRSSVWYGAVIRGDIADIRIGINTNIQDNCVVHVSRGIDTRIGDGVTIGHGAVIHACKIANNCLIGMNTVILDGAEIGQDCIIGANSFVPRGVKIPAGSLSFGSPAKTIRSLTQEEIQEIKEIAERNFQNIMINSSNNALLSPHEK